MNQWKSLFLSCTWLLRACEVCVLCKRTIRLLTVVADPHASWTGWLAGSLGLLGCRCLVAAAVVADGV